MADGITPNTGLAIITPTRSNWADAANNNFKILDAVVGAYFVINSLQGIWANSTTYAIGNSVIDTTTGTLFQSLVAHTSSALPTTFALERVAHPTYWGVYAAPARSRGTWLPNTAYLRNDFVVSGSQYCIALESHTSGSIFSVDLAAAKWSVLVDLSAAGSQILPVPSAPDANKFTMVNGFGSGYTILGLAAVLSIMGVTSVGQALMQASSQGAARTAIGAQIAGSYQPLDDILTALSLLSPTANRIPYFDATAAAQLGTLGAFGLSFLAVGLVADARTALGLGSAALVTLGPNVDTLLATFNSTNLKAALTDETGGGAAVFADSPALTGTPTAPTAAVGTNTTQIATMAALLAAIPSLTVAGPVFMGADVPLLVAGTWYPLASLTQGIVGTWIVVANCAFQDNAATNAAISVRLHDTAATLATAPSQSPNNAGMSVMVATIKTAPGGNISLEAMAPVSTTQVAKANKTGLGNLDTWIFAARIA